MEYRRLMASLALIFTGACVGEGLLPKGPLSGAVGGAVRFTTTLQPTALPFVSVGWGFNGNIFMTHYITSRDLVNATYEARVTLDRATGSLELRDLVLRDSGEYLVSIHPDGEAIKTGSVRLNVYAPIVGASITSSAPSTPLIAGESAATLICNAAGSTVTAWEWTKSGRPFLPSPGHVTFSRDGKELSIDPVLSEHHGNYQCRVSNPVSAMVATYNLTVNFGPQNMSIVGPQNAPMGSTVLLRCSADSIPPPTYSWVRDGNDTFVTNSTYVIERMEGRHQGNYTCTANNQVTKLENSTRIDLRASASDPCWSFALLTIVALAMGESRLTC